MPHLKTPSLSEMAMSIVKKSVKPGGKDSKLNSRDPSPCVSVNERFKLVTGPSDLDSDIPFGVSVVISAGEKITAEPRQQQRRRAESNQERRRKPSPASISSADLPPKNSIRLPVETSFHSLGGSDRMDVKRVPKTPTRQLETRGEETGDGLERRSTHEGDLKLKLLSAQENEQRLVEKVKQLEGQLQQQTQRSVELDRAWKKSTATLADLQQHDPHDEVDDSNLQRLYDELVFDVANWAGNFCRAGAMRVIESKRSILQALSPSYSSYLHDEALRPLLLQSLLMRLLVRDVLSSDGDGGCLWAGSLSKSVCRMQNKLMPDETSNGQESSPSTHLASLRDFAHWKAKSAVLVAKRANKLTIEASINKIVSKFKQDLYMYVPASSAEVWKELHTVVWKAAKLDEEMTKSRAILTFSHWSEEDFAQMKFDGSRMQSALGFATARPGMSVELVLAPAIVQTGSANGQSYDKTSYLSKWKVVCRESRKNGR